LANFTYSFYKKIVSPLYEM